MTKVSVIIPVYNVENYLRQTLGCCINQTLQDIEIICINDGSKDKSLEILEEFAQKDSRIIVVNQENAGMSAARNAGLNIAKGEFIAFLDSDDYVSKDYYEALYNAAKEHGAEIAAAGIVRKYPDGKEVYRIKYEKVQETTDVVKMFEISNIKDYPSVWNRIYTKELLDRIGLRFVVGRYYEDRGFSIRALNNCKKFVSIPQGLYYYVVNPTSVVRSALSEKKKADKLFSRRDGVKYVKDNNIPLPDKYFEATKYKVKLGPLTLYTMRESLKTDTYFLFGYFPIFSVKTGSDPIYQLDKMIVKSRGRMANQMFCWAFAKSLSKHSGVDFLIDDSSNTQKMFSFKCFEEYKKHSVHKNSIKSILRTIIPIPSLRNKISKEEFKMPHKEEEFFAKYQPELLEEKEPTYFTGFYQTHKYFDNFRDELIEDFSLNLPLNKKNKEVLEKIKSTESISVHFRRGDYMKARNAALFGSCSEEYYQNAIKSIVEKTGKTPTLFVFSDDIKWVRENIKFDYETVYVDVNNDKQGYFDLELMKNCKHNVIANSSFSWWGAWLNQNPEKVVVAPIMWLADFESNEDLIPSNWVKL